MFFLVYAFLERKTLIKLLSFLWIVVSGISVCGGAGVENGQDLSLREEILWLSAYEGSNPFPRILLVK